MLVYSRNIFAVVSDLCFCSRVIILKLNYPNIHEVSFTISFTQPDSNSSSVKFSFFLRFFNKLIFIFLIWISFISRKNPDNGMLKVLFH